MFVARGLYLIGDGSHEGYWNKVIKVFVLNHLHMHNECMHVHCPAMLVWCSLLFLVPITTINMRALHPVVQMSSYKHAKFYKIHDRSYEIHMCDALACFKFKLSM